MEMIIGEGCPMDAWMDGWMAVCVFMCVKKLPNKVRKTIQ